MTPDTPPVLYISADTSDLTTRFKATPRMHPGAEVWVPKDTLDAVLKDVDFRPYVSNAPSLRRRKK